MKDTWRHCNGTVIYSRKPPVVLWSLVCTARVIKQKGKIHCKWHWTPLVVTQNNFQQKNLLGNEWWRAVGSIKYGEKRLPLNSFWERGNFPHKYYDFRHEAIYEGAQRMCNKDISSFIVFLQLRWPIKTQNICYFMHVLGYQWEHWSLTITKRVQFFQEEFRG